MNNNSFMLLFIVAILLNISLAIYGWWQRHVEGAMVFSLAMLLFAALPLAEALNESSSDLAVKTLALKIRADTAGIGATAWLVMMMQLTGHSHFVSRRNLLALAIIPLVFMALNWTENPLFRSGYHLETINSIAVLRWSNGPLFWFGFAYLNALLLMPLYLLWRSYRGSSPLSLHQTLALSISVILPIALNLLIQLGIIHMPGDKFPFAAGPLMGLIVAWAIFRYRVFDVVPIARGLLIESMSDGVAVLDSQNRIVDINPAMQQMLGAAVIGQTAESVFAAWPDLIARFRDVTGTHTEIMVDEDPPQYFDLRISPLYDRSGRLTSRLIVVRDITHHKQTEAALRASENNLRRMLESAPDAMLIADQAGKITFTNTQSEKMFGYAQAELIGQPVERLLPERFLEIHKTHRTNYSRNPQTRPMGAGWVLPARRRDGAEFPVEISLSPLETETGMFYMAAVRNVTERKQMEAQLRLQAAALKAAANAIVITDREGVIQWVNPAFTQLTGYTAAEALGQTPKILRSYRQSDAFYKNLWNTIQAGFVWEDEIINRRKDGYEYVEQQTITPLRDEAGEISHFISIKQDITARRRIEEALVQERDLLQALMDNIPDTIYFKDTASRFTRVNRAQLKVLGAQKAEDVIGKTDLDFQARELAESFYAEEQTIIETADALIDRIEYNPTTDGRPRWFSATKVPLKNEEGKITGLVGISRDITRQKQTEETLRRQNNYLTMLHEVTLGLINRREPDLLLESILFQLGNLMETHHAFVSIIDPAENVLIDKVATGYYVSQLGYRTQRGEGLTGRVWDTGELLIIPDYQTWAHGLQEFLWIRTIAAIPMKVQEKVIGVIALSFDEPDRTFTSEEIGLLQRFANLAALALDSAQLISEAIRKSQELSLLHEVRAAITRELDLMHIVKRAVEAVAETFGYTLVSLYLREGDALILQHQVGYEHVIPIISITEGISGRVIRSGQPILLEDVNTDPSFLGALEGIISEVSVPIFDEGEPVGVFNVESRHGVKLTKADLQLMLELCDQIGLAISRARLYDSLRRNNERLSLLHQTTLDLLKERNMEDLLQAIVDQASKLLEADLGYLALAEGEMLVDRAISPRNASYEKVALKREEDKSPVRQVFDTREPLIATDFSSLSTIRPQTRAMGVKATILLPLMTAETCQGVLGVGRMRSGYIFTEEDVRLNSLFASVAGLALDNVQLHETLRDESIRDPLTGLFNRRFMEESLAKELQRVNRNSSQLAVVMLDLDHLKEINDTFGHSAGDEALRRLSTLLKMRIRASDIACRYGGDEFTLILPEVSLENTLQRMEELRKDIKQLAMQHQGQPIHLTISVGIAIYLEPNSTPEALLKLADEALYRAKRAGRDRVVSV